MMRVDPLSPADPFAEPAFAKVNLDLQVGAPRPDGMHPLVSLFASIDLADQVRAEPAAGGAHEVVCDAVEGDNLCAAALVEYERASGEPLEPLRVEITKRIPIAAGLGGGSADAAATLRIVERLAKRPLGRERLLAVATRLGADVPSQVEPTHAVVTGVGEIVHPVSLPALGLVLVPAARGLATTAVYRELDRLEAWRDELDPEALKAAFEHDDYAVILGNDLEAATLSLRPELAETLAALRATVPLFALVAGSGPTCFGAYPTRADAEGAVDLLELPNGSLPPIVCSIRQT